jgi:hypothetical protein
MGGTTTAKEARHERPRKQVEGTDDKDFFNTGLDDDDL